jgi:tetratricopeptide (TPR) repeat protein
VDKPFAAYKGDLPYIFVCYAHEDSDAVYPEIAWLHNQGVNIWYDEGISPGLEWTEALASAIQGSSKILFFVTPHSVTSEHCRRELNFAQEEDHDVVAVHLGDTEVSPGLRLSLNNRQAILRRELSDDLYRHELMQVAQTGAPDPAEPVPQTSAAQPSRRRGGLAIALLAAVAVVALVGGAWWFSFPTSDQTELFDRSITVTPLRVLGTDETSSATAIAVTEAVRDVLTGYQEIRTLSTVRENKPHDIPSYSVGGNIQDSGAHWQVRLRLTRSFDGQHVWSQTFSTSKQASSADLQAISTRAARFIRSQLVQDHRCQMVKRKTSIGEAATAYCAALRESYRAIQVGDGDPTIWIGMARQAVELDPQIIHAYTLIADGHLRLGGVGIVSLEEAGSAATAAVEEGLAIDFQHPSLIATRANIQRTAELDYESSERNYLRALQIAPLDPDAYQWHAALGDIAMRRGYPEQAIPHYARSIKFNDSDGGVYHEYARVYMCAGEYRAALDIAKLGADIISTGSYGIRIKFTKVRAYVFLGEMEEARKALDEGIAAVGEHNRWLFVAVMALLGEDRDVIERYLSKFDPEVGGDVGVIVFTYASLGDADEFFKWAHHGLELRGIGLLQYLRSHPVMLKMKSDPRWPSLIEHLERIERQGLRT